MCGVSICVRFPLHSPSKQAICRDIHCQTTPLNEPLGSECMFGLHSHSIRGSNNEGVLSIVVRIVVALELT